MKISEAVKAIFTAMNTTYDEMNNLMQDLALGREMYDAENDRVISKAEANAKVLDFSRQVLGITDVKDVKAVRRAIRDNGRQWFDIIEDTVDRVVEIGLKESDWFNDVVEYKNIAFGDRQDFILQDRDAILSVAKAGTSHNDHILQRLRQGQVISIPTDLYVVKIGADINKYILGDVDWARLINAIAIAYENMIEEQVYAEVLKVTANLPAQFKGTGALSAATKPAFDMLIERVSAANNGAEVLICGTKPALSKITAIADVQWGADAQKNSMMNSGNIGIYEGTRLMIIPNRFKDAGLVDLQFPTDELVILPVTGDQGKFVKVIDEGDTQIIEKLEREDYLSDLQTYQVSRRLGVGSVVGHYIGSWTHL